MALNQVIIIRQININIQSDKQVMNRFWLEKKRHIIEKSVLHKISPSLKNLPLQIFLKAVTPYSGPMALLYDKNILHHYILPKGYESSIIILNVRGEVKKLIDFTIKDRIIYFGFLKYEELLIVDASGDFWIVDPYSTHIISGNFGGISNMKTEFGERPERFRGCEILPKQKLLLLKGKKLGITHSLHTGWQPFLYLKPSIQNPLFCSLGEQYPTQFIFLSKHSIIQHYDYSTQSKSTLFHDIFLSENSSSLLGLSYNKKKGLLGLIYKQPSKMLIHNVNTNVSRSFEPVVDLYTGQEAIFRLNNDEQKSLTLKYKSINKYKSISTSVGWFSCSFEDNRSLMTPTQQDNFLNYFVFCNGQMLILSNGESFHMQIEKNLLYSIQIDCIRIIAQDGHIFYRLVPYLYRLLVNPDQLNQSYYHSQLLKYVKLRDQYSNYLNGKIVDTEVFTGFTKKRLSSQSNVEVQEEGKEQKQLTINFQRLELVEMEQQIVLPLIAASKYCIDPVDQVKIMKFICFIKNYFESKIDIKELCEEFRIINSLKFEYLNRMLTYNQFENLKYYEKERFLMILLRYNMHYIADMIFKSPHDWLKIFLHWSKCKIQKNNDTVAFEEIKDKFQNLQSKNKNTHVFTEIAKYCMDRSKFNLAENFIQLEKDPDRKIMIYLMIINARKDRKMIDRLLTAAEQTKQQYLIYMVIKQLIEASWVENHIWVNILYGKPRVTQYYIHYLKHHKYEQLLTKYYHQNKQFDSLAYHHLSKIIEGLSSQEDIRTDYEKFSKFKQEDTLKIISEHQSYKKLAPNLSSAMKSYKSNEGMDLLRKLKNGEIQVNADKINTISDGNILQYLGEILIRQQKEELAIHAFTRIKSDKAYSILERKGKAKQAMKLAVTRKNNNILLEMKEKYPTFDKQIQECLSTLSNRPN